MQKETTQFEMSKTNLSLLFGLLFILVLFSSSALGQYYAYITNYGGAGELSIVDLSTNTVIATVPVGNSPQGVAINPAGTAVYIANTGNNSCTVIDTTTLETTTIPGSGGYGATGVAVHPDGTRIYVTNPEWFNGGSNSKVWVIDRATNTVIDEISCGKGSCGVAVHPDGTVAYVTNAHDGTIAVFDTDTHEVIDTIILETVDPDENNFPVPIIVHPAGTYIYAANRKGPTFWAINTATHESIEIASGNKHLGIGINPAGTIVYVANRDDNSFSLYDTKTLELVTTIEDMNTPNDITVHPDGTRVYITNKESNSLSVFETGTNTLITNITVGSGPLAYGEFICPGVPRLLKANAVSRLEAVKVAIEGNTEGVVSPQQAFEHIETALISGNQILQENLWAITVFGEIDPRRLQASSGDIVFDSEQTMVEAVINTLRRGWILNTELRSELLAIVDEATQADRVLVAAAIDDAIVAGVDSQKISEAQEILEIGDVLVKEAAVWEQLDKKASLLYDAINQYRNAWKATVDLIE